MTTQFQIRGHRSRRHCNAASRAYSQDLFRTQRQRTSLKEKGCKKSISFSQPVKLPSDAELIDWKGDTQCLLKAFGVLER